MVCFRLKGSNHVKDTIKFYIFGPFVGMYMVDFNIKPCQHFLDVQGHAFGGFVFGMDEDNVIDGFGIKRVFHIIDTVTFLVLVVQRNDDQEFKENIIRSNKTIIVLIDMTPIQHRSKVSNTTHKPSRTLTRL